MDDLFEWFHFDTNYSILSCLKCFYLNQINQKFQQKKSLIFVYVFVLFDENKKFMTFGNPGLWPSLPL